MPTRTTCEQVVGEISRYIEGCLPAKLQARIERDLRLCGRCAVVLGTTQKLLAIVADDTVFVTPWDGKDGWHEQFLENLKLKESFPTRERFL